MAVPFESYFLIKKKFNRPRPMYILNIPIPINTDKCPEVKEYIFSKYR